MITLNYSRKSSVERKKIVSKYASLNLRNRNKAQIEELNTSIYALLGSFFPYVYDLRSLLELEPDKLSDVKKRIEEHSKIDPFWARQLKENGNLLVNTLYTRMNKASKEVLLNALNLRVCPYCNRNFINSDGTYNTCELDHFYPISKYPILAASFYNLIPVCSVCNRKKSDHELVFYPHSPEKKSPFRFSYALNDANFLDDEKNLSIIIDVTEPRYQQDIELLQLKQIYQTHRREVQDLLKKHIVFSDRYISALQSDFPQLFSSTDEITGMIYGIPMEESEYENVPLSKLKGDILEELK